MVTACRTPIRVPAYPILPVNVVVPQANVEADSDASLLAVPVLHPLLHGKKCISPRL